ncbi:MAG: hypothetical protein LBD41_03395 [Clostridiales Family XIII bacterium]|jgi:tight adherence protein B|nr:hypothetical protein [Clostridiales Family XIII bacterium]
MKIFKIKRTAEKKIKNKIKSKKNKKAIDIKYYLISAILFFSLGMIFYKNIILSLVFMLCIFPAKKYYDEFMKDKKRRELTLEFKDLLYSLSASFSSGRDMKASLLEGYENLKLIYPANAELVKNLEEINRKINEEHQMEDIILKDFAMKSENEDIINFFNAYLTAKESGGDIEKLINSSCKTLIDKIEIDNEIQTITAKKKFEGRILTIVPIILILIMQISGGGYIDILYAGLAGRIVMTLALFILCFSFYLSSKISDIKI